MGFPRCLPNDCINQFQDFSFHCLTSFSLTAHIPIESTELYRPLDLLLNSLASSCHTLVNVGLHSTQPFPILHLVKKVNWPSLKRLTLSGRVQLYDRQISEEEHINLCLSFFSRHPQLERLFVRLRSLGHMHNTQQFVDELSQGLPPLLPSLRSLDCDVGPIPIDVLSRLEHFTSLYIPADLSVHSLRSCAITKFIGLGDLKVMVEALPGHLERLSVTIVMPSCYIPISKYGGFLEEVSKAVSPLRYLTHLVIYTDRHPFEYVDDMRRSPHSIECYVNCLPSLTYFQFGNGGWLRQTPDDPAILYTGQFHSLGDVSDWDATARYWGEYFLGPTITVSHSTMTHVTMITIHTHSPEMSRSFDSSIVLNFF